MIDLIICAAMLSALMCLTHGLYTVNQNASTVDVSWGLGFLLVGTYYLYPFETQKAVCIAILLLIWSARLSFFLFWTRVRLNLKDSRYEQLSTEWDLPKSKGFFLHFQLQGAIIFMMTLPLWLYTLEPQWLFFKKLDYLFMSLIILGILGESIADWQLYQFKKNRQSPILKTGLWRYSRHPNYFFEWLTWIGFSGCVFHFELTELFSLKGLLSLISWLTPVILTWIFFCFSGPRTEQSMLKSKGLAFKEYQEQTPFFFPRFGRGTKTKVPDTLE